MKLWTRRALGLFLATAPGALHAQTIDDNMVTPNLPLEYDRGRNTGVLDRPRPEYATQGIPVGGFRFQPKMEVDTGYTSNVYQNTTNTSDGYIEFLPSAVLGSNWSRHELTLGGSGRLRRYFTEGRRNSNGWSATADGRYDISGNITLSASARARKDAEPPTSAAYPTSAAAPSQYINTTVQVTPAATLGRFKVQGSYIFTNTSFDPVLTFAGTRLDQTNRNSNGNSGVGRVEYAVSPDTSVFVQGNYDKLSYLHDLAPGVPNRNSNTYRVLVGASFDLASLVRGAVGVGYMSHSYNTPIYPNFADFTAEARIDYFMTELTTFTLTARRIAQDATLLNLGGYINSSVALRADHELRRNILLDAQVAYEHDGFKGSNASLDILRTSAGVRYMANRSLGFGISVQHDQRRAHNTNQITPYSETRALFSVVFQR